MFGFWLVSRFSFGMVRHWLSFVQSAMILGFFRDVILGDGKKGAQIVEINDFKHNGPQCPCLRLRVPRPIGCVLCF